MEGGHVERVARSPAAMREFSLWDFLRITYAIEESVAIEVPGGEELDSLALGLGPGAAVGQWSEQGEDGRGENEEGDCGDPVDDGVLADADARNASSEVVKDLA